MRFVDVTQSGPTRYRWVASPAGELLVSGVGSTESMVLTGVSMTGQAHAIGVKPEWLLDPASLERPARQLTEYFEGTRTEFDLEVGVDWQGTQFQKSVWHGLAEIGYGQTLSYRELAVAIGRPRAVRAVGAANGRNPIAIIIPCHRVIAADGGLGGYGGGLARKKLLLDLER